MIRHLFKLMWNQKRKNLGLLVEVFFSFLVIFAVFTFLVHNFKRYQQPLGFEYDRVWVLSFNFNSERDTSYEVYSKRVDEQLMQIDQVVRHYPEFESYSFCSGNLPYFGSQHITGLSYEGESSNPYVYAVDERFPQVLHIPLVEGRWFKETDLAQEALRPIVINRQLAEYFFENESPIGKKMTSEDKEATHIVVGVIDNYKQQGEFSKTRPAYFEPRRNTPTSALLIKVKPGTDATVEARLFEDIQQLVKDWTLEMNYLDEMRRLTLMETWVPALIFIVIAGFLIFNVTLGLFGVVWQNINKRRQEIGVRRAMGATKTGIRAQIVGEIAVLATLSLLLGVFFAVQFPLLNVFNLETEVYVIAMILAVSFIYAIVLICSYYPSRLAAKVHPAVALHEE